MATIRATPRQNDYKPHLMLDGGRWYVTGPFWNLLPGPAMLHDAARKGAVAQNLKLRKEGK